MLVPQKETITIVDNIDVVVPASNNLMTPYVLKEQKDWFEDEIRFVRKFLRPGMHAIDIGANYGLYTLSIAKRIGERGKLWAFEPTSSVAECLNESLSANKLNNTTLIQAGVSNRSGEAKLSIGDNAELNSLLPTGDDSDPHETVKITTLDETSTDHQWQQIDFIKLDAEGEEARIIDGGKRVLEEQSPVILFELRHGDNLNLPLVEKLEAVGYRSFYLLPGPLILVPFDKNNQMDKYQLNLFAMKEDTIAQLSARGLLVDKTFTDDPESDARTDKGLWKKIFKKRSSRNHSMINGTASSNHAVLTPIRTIILMR